MRIFSFFFVAKTTTFPTSPFVAYFSSFWPLEYISNWKPLQPKLYHCGFLLMVTWKCSQVEILVWRCSQFDQRGSYTKLLHRSSKIHQLCILSSTIQWYYPKYWKLLCHKSKILTIWFLTLWNWLFWQTGVKMAQRFSIFCIIPLNCGWQNT